MKYINPFVALGLDPSKQSDPETLRNYLKDQRKRLLAQFELMGTPEIELGGKAMDRSTILNMFEMLENEAVRPYHVSIYEHPKLLAFLEDASLDLYYEGDIHQVQLMSRDFQAFVGPYFAAQFNKRLFNAYRQHDWEEVQILCTPPLSIPAKDHATAYQDTYRQIHHELSELEQYAQHLEQGGGPDAKVQAFSDEMLISTLNKLPEYFHGVKEKYALGLERLALALHNEHRRVELAIVVLKQAMKLDLTPATRERLKYLLDQLVEMAPAEAILENLTGRSGDGKNNKWVWAVGVGAAIFIIIRWLL
ncbi:hypothetical protein [Pontibacter sp. G13]|uniref:hypothetical protein n=1 Tax=Pontibacter sp. G13 TaxID=3074898 RepID=UPI00288AACC5|nr:hypothetical protein [Pontibacter sp. G13]WNJ16889.1 hypothetical protein RJD25_18650 [Pontibacter sp. G13]